MDLEEQTIASELIYDGRIVHLYLDTVRMPNGRVVKREIVRHGGAVAMAPFDEEGQLLLVRQFRAPAGQALLEIPAGTLDPNEEPEECARRELQEEIGYRPRTLERLGGVFLAPGYTSEYIHIFVARDLEPSSLPPDEDEILKVERVPFAEALRLIEEGIICDGKSVAALMWIAHRRAAQAGNS